MGSPFPFKETVPKFDLPGFTEEISRNRGLKGAVHAKCSVGQFMEVRRQAERWFLETLLFLRRSPFPARLRKITPSSAGSQSSRLEEHKQARNPESTWVSPLSLVCPVSSRCGPL